MKKQVRLLFIGTLLALALGWFGLRTQNEKLEQRVEVTP